MKRHEDLSCKGSVEYSVNIYSEVIYMYIFLFQQAGTELPNQRTSQDVSA